MQEESDGQATSHDLAADNEFWSAALGKTDVADADVANADDADAEDSDAGVLAASAVAEIDKLMSDLVSAREYLSAEAERVRRETARLRSLSKTAVASVQIISDNLSKWRQNGKQAA
jgi:hypothetical protein